MRSWNTDIPNPIDPAFWLRPASEIDGIAARLHAEAPLDWFEEVATATAVQPPSPGYWCVTRHADIATVSRNPQVFSSAAGITIGDTNDEAREFFSSMIAMDDPRHARLRRIVAKGFTPKMIGALERNIRDCAHEIIDAVCERGACDFVDEVAAELPLLIVCDLMGIPRSHYRTVFDHTNVILGLSDPDFAPDDDDFVAALINAGAGLAAIMEEVALSKAGSDSEDLTTVLVNADLEDDQLSGSDLASFFVLLTVAGNETTRNSISWGLKYLTDHPDQRAVWQQDFQGVASTAVEEIVRLASPVSYMRRTALSDFELDGRQIAAGDKVAMFYYFANRDPAVFHDPYRFDVRRDPNPQYGFGGPGPHFCLGAHLARREIAVMFETLFERLPDIVATDEPDVLMSSFIHGVKHLTAEFTPAAPLAA